MASKGKIEQIDDLAITKETEIKHRVISAIRLVGIGYKIGEALKIYNITIDQYHKYKHHRL